jgi:hypothetical protein
MFEYGVGNRQQLAPAGYQGHLRRLPNRTKLLIEGLKHRMMAHYYYCPPIQHASNHGPAAPHGAVATPRPAIPMERGDAHQGGKLLEA